MACSWPAGGTGLPCGRRLATPEMLRILLASSKARRHWRGRTRRHVADEYEAYNYEVGIKPLIEKATGVQTLRDDRADEPEFITISSRESVEAMSRFTGGDPTRILHVDRDPEFLIELPSGVQILRILTSHGNTGGDRPT